MPFTPSHVAAALPFMRTPLLPAAVVVGTMAPDIPYYVPLFVSRELSHSLLGLVTFDLAMGLVGVLLWWLVLREPVVDLLPRAIGSRIPAAGRLAWRPAGWGWPLTAAVLVLSLLIGGVTHLLWDSFTHPGWVADHLGVLRVQLGPLLVEKWLQHASTVVGLVIVVIWSVRRLRTLVPAADRSTSLTTATRAAVGIAVVATGSLGGSIIWIHGIVTGVAPFDPGLVFAVARVGVGSASAALILAVMLLLIAKRSRRARPAS